MKRFSLFLLLFLGFGANLMAQFPPTFSRSHIYGANVSSPCWDVGPQGVSWHMIKWTAPSTVTGGTIKLIGSDSANCASPTDIITAVSQTGGGVSNVYFSTKRYVQIVPASFTGTGGLVTSWYSGWIVDPVGAFTYNSTLPGPLTNGQLTDLQVDDRARMRTANSAYPAITTSATLQNAATANGNGTVLNVDGMSTVAVTAQCTTCSGGTQIIFEVNQDGTNWTPIVGVSPFGGNTATATTSSGITYWRFGVAGFKEFRARILTYSAGTVTVTATASPYDAFPNFTSLTTNTNTVDTEFATASSLGDGESNPNTARAGAMNMCYNGTTWDRCKAAATGAGTINTNTMRTVTADDDPVNDAAVKFNTQMVADGAAVAGNPLRIAGKDGSGNTQDVLTDTDGNIQADILTLPANASVNIAQVGGTNTSVTNPLFTSVTPTATGGWDTFNATGGDGSTACTNSAQAVKGSAGRFGGYEVFNSNATTIYIILYNTASGSVTVGTTNPRKVIGVPAGALAHIEMTNGVEFGTAIAVACVTTAGGNTAPASGVDLNVLFK